jgi:colicin import membrane protein
MKNKDDSFSRFIILSVGFHLAIVFILSVRVMLFPAEAPISQRSVRVDVVALPEKMEPAKPQPAPKPQTKVAEKKVDPPKPKEVPKAKPKPTPKPKAKKVFSEKKAPETPKKNVKEEQDSALARLKAMQKLKESQQAKEKERAIEYKGNELSKGNSLTGLEKLHHESYLDDLDSHIRNHWNLPEWLADGNFKASVILKIDKRGGIIDKKFIVRSGNELFDQQVISTIEKANPLPEPPTHLVNFYSSRGVEIRFPE